MYHQLAVSYLPQGQRMSQVHENMSRSIKDAEKDLRRAFSSGSNEVVALRYLDKSQLSNKQIGSLTSDSHPGWTLVHLACRKGWFNAVKTLVETYKCKAAGIKNDDGQTPLFLACRGGHFDIIKYLVTECNCNPELDANEPDGTTAFQVACMYDHLRVVEFLVNAYNCDPLRKDRVDETPLIDAIKNHGNDIVDFFLSIGKVNKPDIDEAKRHVLMKKIKDLRRAHPFHPAYKVFVVGNQSAGKSTLVKALKDMLTVEGTLLSSWTGRFKRVAGVAVKTAGIVPIHIKYGEGQIILFDFAGQYEYYSSHMAYLENIASSPGVLFLLVVDISKTKEEVQRTLYYWSSFISNLTSQPPNVIIIGSHADVAKMGSKKVVNAACKKLDGMLGTYWKDNTLFLDCRQTVSGSLNSICESVLDSSQKFLQNATVDVQVHCIYGVIKGSHLGLKVACRVQDIVELVHAEENASYLADNILPSDVNMLSQHLSTLSEHGQLLYLKDQQDINGSWVILNKELLLSEVNGTIFAPKDFDEHCDISSSTGVVPLSEIKNIFSKYDPEMIISFLTHLKFCHRVEDAEALIIDQGRSRRRNKSESESYYFFPGLINEDRPEESCRSIERTYYRCGWCLERIHEDRFLSTRFLHMLLLRLAFQFALDFDCKKSPAFLQKSCNVWKSGIHWQNNDGVEAIVEVVEQSTAVMVVIGCQQKAEVSCIQLRSDLIKTILQTKEKFSGAVEVKESFLNPSELGRYPPQLPLKDLTKFGVKAVARAVSEEKYFITRKRGFEQQTLPLKDLLLFEICSVFGTNLLCEIFDRTNFKKSLNPTVLKELAIKMRREVPEQLSGIVRLWNKRKHRTYGDLHISVSCYSVFSGRNPLVLGGLCDMPNGEGPLTVEYPCAMPKASASSGVYDEWEDLEPEVTTVDLEETYTPPRKCDKPTMRYLHRLNSPTSAGKPVKVIQETASRYEELATHLNIEHSIIESVKKDHPIDSIGACRKLLYMWLEEEYRKPVTWSTLIECLRDAEFDILAKSLKKILT